MMMNLDRFGFRHTSLGFDFLHPNLGTAGMMASDQVDVRVRDARDDRRQGLDTSSISVRPSFSVPLDMENRGWEDILGHPDGPGCLFGYKHSFVLESLATIFGEVESPTMTPFK